MDDFAVDRVMLAVERIPAGRVATYGDIGRIVGTSARRVGSILARFGDPLPWWRVVGANGAPGGGLIERARPHWRAEGISITPNGTGCRLSTTRADLAALERAYRAALDELISQARTPLPALAADAAASLATRGVTSLEHVLDHSEAELLSWPAIGEPTLARLADELARLGWTWSARPRRDGQPGVGSTSSRG